MKQQATIEKIASVEPAYFVIHLQEQESQITVNQQFTDYQQALDYILEQGWQLKREPTGSLHVETRFLKP